LSESIVSVEFLRPKKLLIRCTEVFLEGADFFGEPSVPS